MRKIYVTVKRELTLGYEKEVTDEQFERLKNGDTLEGTLPELYEQIQDDYANFAGGLDEDYAIEDETGTKIQDWAE
jgi:hypothetical protein